LHIRDYDNNAGNSRRFLITPNLRKLRYGCIRNDRIFLTNRVEGKSSDCQKTSESPLFPSTKTKKCNSVILNEVKDLLDYSQFGVSKYVIV
jgi:hypothetical protein